MKTSKENSGRRKVGDRFIDLVPKILEPEDEYTYSQIADLMGVSMKTIYTKMPILREKKVIEVCGFGERKNNDGKWPLLWRLTGR